MDPVTKTYTATATKDITKKRKSWLDCTVTINATNRLVTIVGENLHTGVNPLYRGAVTASELRSLLDREETKCGCLLVLLEEDMGTGKTAASSFTQSLSSIGSHTDASSRKAYVEPTQSRLTSDMAGSVGAPQGNIVPLTVSLSSINRKQVTSSLLKAFKPPTKIGGVSSIKQHSESSVMKRPTPAPALIQVQIPAPTSVQAASPNFSSHVSNVNNAINAPPRQGCNTSKLLSAPMKSVDATSSHKSTSSSTFPSQSKACTQFDAYINPAPKRKIAISTAFRDSSSYAKEMLCACREEVVLLINQTMKSSEDTIIKNRTKSVGTSAFPSMNKINTQHFAPHLHTAMMKKAAGAPLAIIQEVELIKPGSSRSNHSADAKRRKFSEYSYKSKFDDSDYRDTKDEDDCSYDDSRVIPKSLYIKVHGHRSVDKRLPAFSKNDVWLLWAPDSPISEKSLEIFDGLPPTEHIFNDRLKNFSRNIGRDDSAPFRAARAAFIDLRRSRGYCWPWFNGYIFQEVWAVRSMWYGFSGEGMLEVCSLDGSVSVHPNMSKYIGSKTGAYRLAGLRSFNDSQLLMAMDLLRGGAGVDGALSQSVNGLNFPALQTTPIFKSLLDSSDYGGRQARAGTNHDFPIVPRNVIDDVLKELYMEFGLNNEQRRIAQQIAQWFAEDDISDSTRRCSDDVILVDGVFGSGKSHLMSSLAVLMTRLSARGNGVRIKCQISSNTNVAVDRVLTQLIRQAKEGDQESHVKGRWPKVARVGALEKVDKTLVYNNCFIHSTENKKSIINEFERALKKDGDPRLKDLMRVTSGESNFIEKQRSHLQEADVIGVTCASAGSTLLTGIQSHVLILDEVSQMTEALSLLPIASAQPIKILLIGDPKQLPPVTAAMQSGEEPSDVNNYPHNDFTRTMFDRLVQMGSSSSSLRIQYRCHPHIAEICSHLFYDGSLKHGVDELSRLPLLPRLSTITALNNVGEDTRNGESSINKSECKLICRVLMMLKRSMSGSPSRTIGVICMYRAQAYEINQAMANMCDVRQSNIVISTVDAFQGSEMDIIIICTTRNTASEFISNPKRVNVAISRAKYHLILVGNIRVLRENSLWSKVFSFPHTLINDFQQFEYTLNGKEDECDHNSSQFYETKRDEGNKIVVNNCQREAFVCESALDIDEEEAMIEEAIAIEKAEEEQQKLLKHKQLRLNLPQQREYENTLPTEQHEVASPKFNKDLRGSDFERPASSRVENIDLSVEKEKENTATFPTVIDTIPPSDLERVLTKKRTKKTKKRPRNVVMSDSTDEDDCFRFAEDDDDEETPEAMFMFTRDNSAGTKEEKMGRPDADAESSLRVSGGVYALQDATNVNDILKKSKKPKRAVD